MQPFPSSGWRHKVAVFRRVSHRVQRHRHLSMPVICGWWSQYSSWRHARRLSSVSGRLLCVCGHMKQDLRTIWVTVLTSLPRDAWFRHQRSVQLFARCRVQQRWSVRHKKRDLRSSQLKSLQSYVHQVRRKIDLSKKRLGVAFPCPLSWGSKTEVTVGVIIMTGGSTPRQTGHCPSQQ